MLSSVSSAGWSARLLPHVVFAAAVLPTSQRMFISNDFGIFELNHDDSLTPIGIEIPPQRYYVNRMHCDSSGAIYFSTRESNRLYRLPSGDTAFHVAIPCLSDKPDGEDTVRGFAEMSDGQIFFGRYSRDRPARLLASNDGETWRTAWEWDARHVHDVRLNPHNGWLYVVVGEGNPDRTDDSHSIWRSKDGGRNFQRIYRPEKTRPLFLPVNFHRSHVILGTDHPAGFNYLVSAADDGGPQLGSLQILFRIPETPGSPRVQPFAYFLEWKEDTLFLGTRGSGAAALYASRNLSDWTLVRARTADAVAFINCSYAVTGKSLLVSGQPGMEITSSESNEPMGIGLSFPTTTEPVWVSQELNFRECCPPPIKQT